MPEIPLGAEHTGSASLDDAWIALRCGGPAEENEWTMRASGPFPL